MTKITQTNKILKIFWLFIYHTLELIGIFFHTEWKEIQIFFEVFINLDQNAYKKL